jgi:two-component system sensor histidine kinase DesK
MAAQGVTEPLPGVSPRLWQIYAHVWLGCLVFPIASLAQSPPALPGLVIAVAGLACYVAFYVYFMREHPLERPAEPGPRAHRVLLAILTVTLLALFLSVALDSSFLWLLVGASIVAGRNLPLRSAHLVATVLPILAVAAGLALAGNMATTDWLHILPLALLVRALGLNMIGLSLQFGIIGELRSAQAELARRAVSEERLRLARDLHDLLGHTLSLIVLKSELAGRLIEREPARATQEIKELESVARQALREVRQAVVGYRQPTLQGELEGARQMLAAAGIAGLVENTTGLLSPTAESVLAWTVREGVTNVIRHSRASKCIIRLTRNEAVIHAEIINDGDLGEAETAVQAGSGLVGLTERVTAQGGTIQASPFVSKEIQGFRLLVELPLSSDDC